jgi:hypothetical protein
MRTVTYATNVETKQEWLTDSVIEGEDAQEALVVDRQ